MQLSGQDAKEGGLYWISFGVHSPPSLFLALGRNEALIFFRGSWIIRTRNVFRIRDIQDKP